RYFYYYQRRRIWLVVIHPDFELAAVGHSGYAQNPGASDGSQWSGKNSANDVSGAVLRPSSARRKRSRAIFSSHQGSAGRPGTHPVGNLSSPHRAGASSVTWSRSLFERSLLTRSGLQLENWEESYVRQI